MIEKNIFDKRKAIGITLEYKTNGGFPLFKQKMRRSHVLLLCDRNTRRHVETRELYRKRSCFFGEDEPVPDERLCGESVRALEECDYVLAVGGSTLNDTAKFAAYATGGADD